MPQRDDPRRLPLPTGDVTFLLTDIEGSTSLFQRLGDDRYREALADHHQIIRDALSAHGGAEVKTEGDAFLAAFTHPAAAAAAALEAQQALGSWTWPVGGEIRVRMGLHRGAAELGEGRDYLALALHQAARVAAVPQGGQVVVSPEVAAALGRSDPRLRPLGRFWLKDFVEPVELFALADPDRPADDRAPRAPRADLSSVPAARGVLFGREAALSELDDLLFEPGVVTVAGPGGVGKTRLTLALAASWAERGQQTWYVELAPLTTDEADRDGVLATIASAVGSGAGSVDALGRDLADVQLLVLDNAEHVVAAAADIVDSLARRCPQLRVLVTSREPLGVDGELVLRLEPLRTPADDMNLVQAASTPSMQLFTSKARSASRTFALTEANWQAVADLCRALDGVPLAIELAASRAASIGPEVILERLRAVGDLPGRALRGKDARHSALHAVLDWSLSLCTDAEVAVLRRMGVFASAVISEAVVAVGGGDGMRPEEVIDALMGLVDKSLVIVREAPAGRTYDLLATVRTAAEAKLAAAGERDEAIQRHAGWLLELADRGLSPGQATPNDRVELIFPELMAALERGASGALPLEVFMRLLRIDRLALTVRVPQACIRYGAVLSEDEQAPANYRASGQVLVASALSVLGHPDLVVETERALELARAGDSTDILLGALCLVLSTLDRADPSDRQRLDQVLEELERLTPDSDDASSASVVWCQLGIAALDANDLVAARRWYTQARDAIAADEINYNQGTLAFNIAEIDELEGDVESALAGYAQAAQVFHHVGALQVEAFVRTHLSGLLLREGRPSEALEAASGAVLAARRARSDDSLVPALEALAAASEAVGDAPRAAAAAAEAAQHAA